MIQNNPYRPNNVKLFVVLESIVAVFLVGGGTAILLLASISVTTLLLGGVHIILGLIAFPAAYGLWAAKQCAWRFALVLSIVSILSSAAQEYVLLNHIQYACYHGFFLRYNCLFCRQLGYHLLSDKTKRKGILWFHVVELPLVC